MFCRRSEGNFIFSQRGPIRSFPMCGWVWAHLLHCKREMATATSGHTVKSGDLKPPVCGWITAGCQTISSSTSWKKWLNAQCNSEERINVCQRLRGNERRHLGGQRHKSWWPLRHNSDSVCREARPSWCQGRNNWLIRYHREKWQHLQRSGFDILLWVTGSEEEVDKNNRKTKFKSCILCQILLINLIFQ